MIKRAIKRAVVPLWNQMYVDIGGGAESTVFLAGTERSGTTWVAESINYSRDYRFMFEPFWNQKVGESAPIAPQEYIRPGDRMPEKIESATSIISGRLRNAWVDKYHRVLIARKRLVKDVRSNLYLKWLHDLFPEMPIILLIRHPCAVAKSQIERKHGFASTEKTFLAQSALVEDHLEPFVDEICRQHSPFEDRIFRWCIQNYVPLRQFRRREICVTFYERLCMDPKDEYARIIKFLKQPFDSKLLSAVGRPSPMSQNSSAVNTGGDLINSWRDAVSPSDAASAEDILKLFGLSDLYDDHSLPSEVTLDSIMRA